MKTKIYITDEGFGPIVRQRAIIEELRLFNAGINCILQTERHYPAARRIIRDISFIKKYNNISWTKTVEGYPDNRAIKLAFKDYLKRSESYIKSELPGFNYDFVVSDFVYEAFEIAQIKGVPSFGVAHFTWDWFFSKLYPPPLTRKVIEKFISYASKADVLYFPPFTPMEILKVFKKKSVEVPFIISKNISHKALNNPDKFKILIIDSGSGVLRKSIEKAVRQFTLLRDFHFYISSSFRCESANISLIDKDDLFIDYINDVDLVIGRAGFNTISECISFRTPMLLLTEAMNPEMNENIIHIKHEGLGSFISLQQFTDNLTEYLPRFINGEYKNIRYNMNNHNYSSDGATVIARDILNKMQ